MARWKPESDGGGDSRFGKGRYLAEVSKSREDVKGGQVRFRVSFKKADGDGAGEFLCSDLIIVSGEHAWIGHKKLEALGFDMSGEGGVIEEHELIGRRVYLNVDFETYDNERRLKPVFKSENFGYASASVEVAGPSPRKKKAAPPAAELPPEDPLAGAPPDDDVPF